MSASFLSKNISTISQKYPGDLICLISETDIIECIMMSLSDRFLILPIKTITVNDIELFERGIWQIQKNMFALFHHKAISDML